MRWSQIGLGAVLVGIAAYFGNETFRGRVSSVAAAFGADGITPANLEEMHIESSGVTIDQVPTSLAEAFLGYQQLKLQGTNSIANDSPFMDGIVDAQPVYVNPHDMGYSWEPAQTGFSAEGGVGQTSSYMDTTNNEFITGPGMPYTQTAHDSGPVSLDPSTGAGVGITYDGSRLPVARLAPEVNSDFPYLVSMIDTPFLTPPSGDVGGNRIGSLARNSTDDSVNGRLGETALSPDVDSSYLDTSTGRTMPLSQWRSTHTILRISDTLVSAIPFSGGFETQLRRV